MPGGRPRLTGACWFRRLRIRWEIRDDIRETFLSLACAIICWCRLIKLTGRLAPSASF
jgi:hypothetical protein